MKSCFEKIAVGDVLCISCDSRGCMTLSPPVYMGLFPVISRDTQHRNIYVISHWTNDKVLVCNSTIQRIIKKRTN